MDEDGFDVDAVNAAYQKYLDAEANKERFKKRSEETWAAVRRGWEAGETGALLAQRYDVGLANLWRRRASEGWTRRERADPVPEPIEGWRRHAALKREAFEKTLAETRAVAAKLVEAMQGKPLEGAPLWHVAFLLHWRAEHLGAEVARRDREWAVGRADWLAGFWDADGRLKTLDHLDRLTLENKREAWREEMGLPEGVEGC